MMPRISDQNCSKLLKKWKAQENSEKSVSECVLVIENLDETITIHYKVLFDKSSIMLPKSNQNFQTHRPKKYI